LSGKRYIVAFLIASILPQIILFMPQVQATTRQSGWLISTPTQYIPYILAGGQQGSWFTTQQYPELVSVSTTNFSVTSLDTTSGQGTIWTGGSNGSAWLATGWGIRDGLDPYIDLFNNSALQKLALSNTQSVSSAELEWAGGDVFSASWNGSAWLLSGMGSGELYPGQGVSNHLSMALLLSNGTFIDLSKQVPNQQDGILYANSWDGSEWLVGGGWYGYNSGDLFLYSPSGAVTDLTSQISSAVPEFNSVQSIAWNGHYFLIGGIGFLASYDPYAGTFQDLTSDLSLVMGPNSLSNGNVNSVNSISWTGSSWLVAGGFPIAFYGSENQTAWVASVSQNALSGMFYQDLTRYALPSYDLSVDNSTILSAACSQVGCVLGGSSDSKGLLVWFDGSSPNDLSSMLHDQTTYIQWVGLAPLINKFTFFDSTGNQTTIGISRVRYY
jgi:hypothetical protein